MDVTDFDELSDLLMDSVESTGMNESLVQEMLPEWVGLPSSIALPFGSFEEVITEAANERILRDFKDLRRYSTDETLLAIRNLIHELTAPAEVRQQLASALAAQGILRAIPSRLTRNDALAAKFRMQ